MLCQQLADALFDRKSHLLGMEVLLDNRRQILVIRPKAKIEKQPPSPRGVLNEKGKQRAIQELCSFDRAVGAVVWGNDTSGRIDEPHCHRAAGWCQVHRVQRMAECLAANGTKKRAAMA
jgi:hypothetical protein